MAKIQIALVLLLCVTGASGKTTADADHEDRRAAVMSRFRAAREKRIAAEGDHPDADIEDSVEAHREFHHEHVLTHTKKGKHGKARNHKNTLMRREKKSSLSAPSEKMEPGKTQDAHHWQVTEPVLQTCRHYQCPHGFTNICHELGDACPKLCCPGDYAVCDLEIGQPDWVAQPNDHCHCKKVSKNEDGSETIEDYPTHPDTPNCWKDDHRGDWNQWTKNGPGELTAECCSPPEDNGATVVRFCDDQGWTCPELLYDLMGARDDEDLISDCDGYTWDQICQGANSLHGGQAAAPAGYLESDTVRTLCPRWCPDEAHHQEQVDQMHHGHDHGEEQGAMEGP